MSVGVYSALFTSRMQTLLLLSCYAVLLSCHHVTQRLQAVSGKRILLAAVRDGKVELRATKSMKRGGRKSIT